MAAMQVQIQIKHISQTHILASQQSSNVLPILYLIGIMEAKQSRCLCCNHAPLDRRFKNQGKTCNYAYVPDPAYRFLHTVKLYVGVQINKGHLLLQKILGFAARTAGDCGGNQQEPADLLLLK
eukprot:5146633-Pleurochrysis_carterae.AAC.1